MYFTRNKYFFLCLTISLVLFLFFYRSLLVDINNYYFVDSGDGIQTYHELMYHATYDDQAFFSRSMQYPYGDNGFFSVNPLLLSTVIQKLNHVIPVAPYAVGIFNFFVLFSIVLGALSLFLILKKIGADQRYACMAAVLVAFLSPQLMRFGGHNSLGYVFAIPFFIYLLMQSWEHPRIWHSVFIALYFFFIAGNHLYYLGFFLLTGASFYGIQLLFYRKDDPYSVLKRICHFVLQVIVPYVLIQIIIYLVHPASDRTRFPWNFFEFTGSIAGVFYPSNNAFPFTRVFRLFIDPSNIIWEAKSYIGLVACIGFVVVLFRMARFALNGQFSNVFYFDENRYIVLLFWTGIAGLLVGLGWPFVTSWGIPLFDHIGYVKQFRGIARFTWIFYYTINIISFYYLCRWFSQNKSVIQKSVLGLCLLVVYASDIYANAGHQAAQYSNRIPELEDKQNLSLENAWLNKIHVNDYQAIIGLPYYHRGSENIYLGDEYSMRSAMIYSLKTGLPTVDIHSNRIPLQESFNTAQLVLEPYRALLQPDRFPDHKSFLLVRDKYLPLSDAEQYMVSNARLIDSAGQRIFYTLPFGFFINAHTWYRDSLRNEAEHGISVDNSRVTRLSFDDIPSGLVYRGAGARSHPCQDYLTIYNDTLKNAQPGEYTVSFWAGNIHTDVILRGLFEIQLADQYGRVYENRQMNMGKRIKIIDGDWALIEDKFVINNTGDHLKLTIWNKEIKGDWNVADELMIRPSAVNYYEKGADSFNFNNRYYLYAH